MLSFGNVCEEDRRLELGQCESLLKAGRTQCEYDMEVETGTLRVKWFKQWGRAGLGKWSLREGQ